MYYYNNELPPQQGWICPKCGRVNAPWLPTCDCVSSQTRATFDTTSLTAKQTEPQTAECPFDDSIPCEWVCTEYGKCKYKPKDEPQTEREGE